MKALYIIGNGFDLAHGLKTSYNDFILDYLKKAFVGAEFRKAYSDGLISLAFNINYNFQQDVRNFQAF